MQGGEGLNSRSTTNGNAEDKGDLRLSTPCSGFKVVEKEYFKGEDFSQLHVVGYSVSSQTAQPPYQSLEVGSVRGGGCLHREALTLLGVAGSGEKPRLNAIEFAKMTVATYKSS
jgi:hypothetical protein